MQCEVGVLGFLMLIGVSLPASAQQRGRVISPASSAAVRIIDLRPDEAIRFSTPAPVAVASKIKCGPSGDIYAAYSTNSYVEVWGSPVRKLSLSSKHVTEYPIPSVPGYEKLTRTSFDVDPHGSLFMLVQAQLRSEGEPDGKFAYLIVKFKDDGTVDTYYPLAELPGKKIHPTSLTMFADGNSLVSGTIRAKDTPSPTLEVFSAIFSETGAYRGQITIMKPDDSTESGPMSSKGSSNSPGLNNSVSLASSLITLGSLDGDIYVLQDEHLNVVSHSGSIEREIKLPAPHKDISPIQMAAAGPGYLFAFYDHISTGASGESAERRSMISVANLQTGDITATYRMSQGETDLAVAACAVSISDFVFLSADQQNNLEVVHYRAK